LTRGSAGPLSGSGSATQRRGRRAKGDLRENSCLNPKTGSKADKKFLCDLCVLGDLCVEGGRRIATSGSGITPKVAVRLGQSGDAGIAAEVPGHLADANQFGLWFFVYKLTAGAEHSTQLPKSCNAVAASSAPDALDRVGDDLVERIVGQSPGPLVLYRKPAIPPAAPPAAPPVRSPRSNWPGRPSPYRQYRTPCRDRARCARSAAPA
jgi:hypothetical protein